MTTVMSNVKAIIDIMDKCSLTAAAAVLLLAAVPRAWSQSATNAPATNSSAIKWAGSAAAGLTLTRGNSHTFLATASIVDDGKWTRNELKLGADAAYGKSSINNVTSETTETVHGFGQYNRLFTERFYGYGRMDGLHDGIADIQYRLTLAPGVGYYFIKEKDTDLSGEFGPGYVIEKLGHKNEEYATLRLAETFHHNLSDRARVWQTLEILPQVDRFDNYIVNFEAGIEADLTADKRFHLRSFLDDSYDNRPAAGRLKNDLKLVTAVAYKF